MKRLLILLVAILAAQTALPCAAETRLTAITVGKGDAILVTSGEYACLIDTGKGYAMGRVRRALRELGVEKLDAVFLTHVDDDHAGGLEWLANSDIAVGAWYASDFYFEYKEKNHPLNKLGLNVTWLRAGDQILAGEAVFSVLAPLVKSEDEENDNSLVLLLEAPGGRALLTGDIEFPAEEILLVSGADLSCDILKVSNHGDGDATSAAFLARAMPAIAILSTDSDERPDTPDPGVLSRLAEVGAQVYFTQGASAVAATLAEGGTAEYLYWSDAVYDGITLDVHAKDDLITIRNAGSADIALDGWYLYSDRGNELFVFEGGVVPAGGAATVGTKSSPGGAYSIFWDDKNVIHDKKEDAVTLYDPDGTAVAYAH